MISLNFNMNISEVKFKNSHANFLQNSIIVQYRVDIHSFPDYIS